ncbi:MAG: COX15/CtaA family protein [Planctomycetes bacterium]|nr:COX15/CtaA family protein [Planctomycetota bacterium]
MTTSGTSPWPRRLALGTWLAALPLVVLGGTVTTLRAGMAIDGWWVLDRGHGDHFLLAYPIEKWFANSGTFAEHSHRLFGTLVGLLSILLVGASHRAKVGATRIKWAWIGLAAVCAQGAIGGFRVLESSPDLAFLHGVFAQATLATLAVNVVLSDPAFGALPRVSLAGAASMRRASVLALLAVYAQIVLGAWLRHTGNDLALVAHIAFAALATGAVVVLARGMRECADGELARRAMRLLGLILAQVVLGLLALVAILLVSGGFTGEVSTAETLTATAHVLFGAFVLQATVAAVMWIHRRCALDEQASVVAGWEGAR